MQGLIVLADGTNRPQWLEARTSVTTATQSAAIVGSHPYAAQIDVWNERTDPFYDREANRNRWLDERAELGVEREPAIIQWAGEDARTGGTPFTPNAALVTREGIEHHACTPDGWKRNSAGVLILVEAKATQQRWDQTGLPQHIIDQCLWQAYVTGAVTVWVAAEFYEWQGRGKSRKAVLVGRELFAVVARDHDRRLAHLLERVARFEQYLADDIAPESDLDMRVPVAFEYDDDAETIARKTQEEAERVAYLEASDNLADLLAQIKSLKAQETVLRAELSKAVKAYDGRRVHLIGNRLITKMVRFDTVKVRTEQLDPATLRSITEWEESERVSYDPNPEWTPPPADTDDAEEATA